MEDMYNCHDLSTSVRANGMVAKAHQYANAIHGSFVSRDDSLLVRGYIAYVRPLYHLVTQLKARYRHRRASTKELPGYET